MNPTMAWLFELPQWAFEHVLHAGWQAALLGTVVLIISGLSAGRLSAHWKFAFWIIVFARLALPAVPASPWSLFNCPSGLVSALADHTSAGNELATPPTLLAAGRSVPSTGEVDLPMTDPLIASDLAVTTSREPRAESRFGPFQWLVFGWTIGAGFLLLRRLRQAWFVSRLARHWRTVDDPLVLRVLETAQRQVGVRRFVQLVETPNDVGPAAIGLWRPRILLPQSLLGKLSSDEFRFVLLHELSHIRRHDVLVDWLAALVTIFHWVNPIAWLGLARIRRLRELACDATVLDIVGVAQHQRYGLAVLRVAEQLVAPWPLLASAGGFGRKACLTKRIWAIRNHRSPSNLASAAGLGLFLALVAVGLTDAWQPPEASSEDRQTIPVTTDHAAPNGSDALAFSGICEDGEGGPLSDVTIRLYRWNLSIPEEFDLLAERVTTADGRFSFPDLPRPNHEINEVFYYCVVGQSPGRATDYAVIQPGYDETIRRLQHPPRATLAGRITNQQGRPIENATVWATIGSRGPAPGLWTATTDADGRYAITDLAPGDRDKEGNYKLTILHDDYQVTRPSYTNVPGTVDAVLARGSAIEGRVIDTVTGHPATAVLVTLQSCKNGNYESRQSRTDDQGRFRLSSLPEGTYNVWADADDRACAAVDSLTVAAGQTVTIPDLSLVEGGWIEGRVIDAETGQPLSRHPENGRVVVIGWYGPSRPKSGSGCQAQAVDAQGNFRLRVPPGTSYPYIMSGDWMHVWPRTSQTQGIEVTSGETKSVVFPVFRHLQPEKRERSPGELPLPVLEEREAVEAIRQLGGWYALDEDQHVVEVNMVMHEPSDGGLYYNPQTHTDAALQHLPTFPRLKRLYLTMGQAADCSMHYIGERSELELLMIWDASDVSDEGVSHLTGLANLNNLHIDNSNLTDRSLAILSRLPRLEKMSLQGNNFTDEGLKHLREMKQLRSLWLGLGQTQFTDAGLANLSDLENLEALGLQGNPITDAGLVHIRKLSNLRLLSLSMPASATERRITDKSLPLLTSFHRMEELNLQGTDITDEGARRLGRLPALKRLILSSRRLSATVEDQLKRDHPKVRFHVVIEHETGSSKTP